MGECRTDGGFQARRHGQVVEQSCRVGVLAGQGMAQSVGFGRQPRQVRGCLRRGGARLGQGRIRHGAAIGQSLPGSCGRVRLNGGLGLCGCGRGELVQRRAGGLRGGHGLGQLRQFLFQRAPLCRTVAGGFAEPCVLGVQRIAAAARVEAGRSGLRLRRGFGVTRRRFACLGQRRRLGGAGARRRQRFGGNQGRLACCNSAASCAWAATSRASREAASS